MVNNIFSLLLLLFTLIACAEKEIEEEHHLKLFYHQPAEAWTEALPVGNGKMAAMVYGNPAREHIQFNEETLSENPKVMPTREHTIIWRRFGNYWKKANRQKQKNLR